MFKSLQILVYALLSRILYRAHRKLENLSCLLSLKVMSLKLYNNRETQLEKFDIILAPPTRKKSKPASSKKKISKKKRTK